MIDIGEHIALPVGLQVNWNRKAVGFAGEHREFQEGFFCSRKSSFFFLPFGVTSWKLTSPIRMCDSASVH